MTKTAAGSTVTYVYDAAGQLAAEYGSVVTAAQPSCQRCFLTADQLGSTRVLTDTEGVVAARYDYYPFGGDLTAGGRSAMESYTAGTKLSQKFTGKERDYETTEGLDYFGARYFSAAQGRWTTPDWSATPQPVPYADLKDPQTFNLYAYARNNPLSHVDSDGHFWHELWNRLAYGLWTINDAAAKKYANDQAIARQKQLQEAMRQLRQQQARGEPVMLRAEIPIGPPGGSVAAGALSKLSAGERTVLEELTASGKNVQPIARGVGKTADFLVDGVATELKTLTSAGPTTLKNAVQTAAKQGQQILIDARNVNMTPQEALGQIQRAQGNIGGLQGRVTVLTKAGAVVY